MTAEDFEQLTLEVAPEIGRAHCLTAAHESHAGVVRVLVVPQVAATGWAPCAGGPRSAARNGGTDRGLFRRAATGGHPGDG